MAQPSAYPRRRSARVILLSPDDEVLLIEFVVQRSDGEFAFWATPGGEIEGAETERAAAARELHEELNLALPLDGPVHLVTSEFEHQGRVILSTDVFFTARCARSAPRLDAPTKAERDVMRRCRWWTLAEIERSNDRIFPEDLGAVMRRIVPLDAAP